VKSVRVAILAVAVIGAVFGAGWLAARTFESPAQRDARARPPAPEPILAAVTRARLADEITARADVRPQTTERLSPQSLPEPAVVTKRPASSGARIRPWTPLLVINGRPLFVVPGRFSFYRDIVPGARGPDVRQLQDGIAAAGIRIPVRERGTYGAATQRAVSTLYAAVGAGPAMRAVAASSGTTPAASATRAARQRHAEARRRPPTRRMPIVPLSEVVVAPRLPAVLSFAASVGRKLEAGKPVASVSAGRLVADADVAASVFVMLHKGMAAQLISDDGRAVRARILSLQAGEASRQSDTRRVRLVATGRRLPPSWNGRNVLARITTRVVSGAELVLPTRGVARGADGTSYVLKEVRGGRFARVRVRSLASLAGRTAVRPLVPGALTVNDRIRVG
jgi:hypothetical protein